MRADNVERIIVDSMKRFIYVLMYRQWCIHEYSEDDLSRRRRRAQLKAIHEVIEKAFSGLISSHHTSIAEASLQQEVLSEINIESIKLESITIYKDRLITIASNFCYVDPKSITAEQTLVCLQKLLRGERLKIDAETHSCSEKTTKCYFETRARVSFFFFLLLLFIHRPALTWGHAEGI
jgi:hypothetical protein